MSDWFYAKNGRQEGPVSLENLRALVAEGKVSRSDLAWNATMKDWQPVGNIAELASGNSLSSPTPADPANPYAAPGSAWQQPSAAPTAELPDITPGSEPFDIMACLKLGWKLTARHFGVLILAMLTMFGIGMMISVPFTVIFAAQAAAAAGSQTDPNAFAGVNIGLSIVQNVIQQLASIFLTAGFTRIALNIASGREATYAQLFSQGGKYLKLIGASLLFYLAMFLGLLLLIVPGIMIACRFGQFQKAIVDRDLGVFESFRYSFEITRNNSMNLIGLFLMGLLIMLAGIIALCVGVVFAVPFFSVSTAIAYRWMQHGHRAVQDHPASPRPLLP